MSNRPLKLNMSRIRLLFYVSAFKILLFNRFAPSQQWVPPFTQLIKPNTQKSNILTSYPVHQLILLNLHLKYVLNLPNCNFVQASIISCRLSGNILYQLLLLSPTVYSLHITSMLNALQCLLIILCLHFNLPVWPAHPSELISYSFPLHFSHLGLLGDILEHTKTISTSGP